MALDDWLDTMNRIGEAAQRAHKAKLRADSSPEEWAELNRPRCRRCDGEGIEPDIYRALGDMHEDILGRPAERHEKCHRCWGSGKEPTL